MAREDGMLCKEKSLHLDFGDLGMPRPKNRETKLSVRVHALKERGPKWVPGTLRTASKCDMCDDALSWSEPGTLGKPNTLCTAPSVTAYPPFRITIRIQASNRGCLSNTRIQLEYVYSSEYKQVRYTQDS